mgnify:CR=1 FL=1
MHIPTLISDLAVMMLTAGIITIIFKRIKQPLILGYILAGFLISPYFPLFTTVVDTQSIHTWSEIGIIFLMFHLGLEFNLHKLVSVGSTAIITTATGVAGMLGIGYTSGMLLGFGTMNSICLGGMLAMSSTTIIIKVFKNKRKIHGTGFRHPCNTGYRRNFYDGNTFNHQCQTEYFRSGDYGKPSAYGAVSHYLACIRDLPAAYIF